MGDDDTREGVRETPRRFVDGMLELTEGYDQDPDAIAKSARFACELDQLVIVPNVEFFSLCEHHLLPFFGRADVGYLPNGSAIGLSKIPRIVGAFSRRLQMQERLTLEVAHCLERAIEPRGVAVIMRARHLCACARGVRATSATFTTSYMGGLMRETQALRDEFLRLIDK